MVETEQRPVEGTATEERWERRPGERFAVPEPSYMYPGHPFTTDPRGGIFDTRTLYTIEEFDALLRRGRGQPLPDGSLLFNVVPVRGVGMDPQLIVKR